LASATIEIAIFRGIPLLHSAFYLWTTPAWLAWYLCSTRPSYATNMYDAPLMLTERRLTDSSGGGAPAQS
jgi:hypothetical protein